MRPGRTTLALAASGIVVSLLAACAGGDRADTTRSEFLARGNAICKQADADIFRATRRTFGSKGPSSNAELIQFARHMVLPRYQRRLAALRHLDIPAGDYQEVDAIVGAMQSALIASRKRPVATTVGRNDPYTRSDRLARTYGLIRCVYT